MKITDIDTLPVKSYMSPEIKDLRKKAPLYLKSLFEHTYAIREIKSISELGHNALSALPGGMLSACYYLTTKTNCLVIKMRYRGIKAEAESLKMWARRNASVITVIKTGIVPATKKQKEKVHFIIEECVLDKKGELAPTCADFVHQHPGSIPAIAKIMGLELARIHKAVTKRSFGEFADMWGKNKAPIKTWNNYLKGYLTLHENYLLNLGLTKSKLKLLHERIQKMDFAKRGVYLHGDFSLRNTLLTSRNPLKIVIFDPNPLIGHPSWDLAISYNNLEFSKRRFEFAVKNEDYRQEYEKEKTFLTDFLKGYEKETKKRIIPEHILTSQLAQTIFLLQIEEQKARTQKKPGEEIEVMVRKDALFSFAEKLTS